MLESGGWHCCAAQGRARGVFWLGAVPTTATFLYSFMRMFSSCRLVWNVLSWSTDVPSGCDSFPGLLLGPQPGRGSTGLFAMGRVSFLYQLSPSSVGRFELVQ